MKTFLRLTLILFLFPPSFEAIGQKQCKVLLEGISETYEGGCRAGLAHGQGVAAGVDRYEGRFRRGLPHGQGTYFWANGDLYQGQWINGERHGEGSFFYSEGEESRELTGRWQNDEFVGERRQTPYTTGHIMNLKRYNLNRTDDGNMVLVTYYTHNRITSPPRDYIFQINSGSSIRVGQSAGFENVIFPAIITITYTHEGLVRVRFEATINEPGVWEIKLYN